MTTPIRSISPDDDSPAPALPLELRRLTPYAATLHRLAAFITENDLPPVSLNVHDDGRFISIHVPGAYCENAVRRWAQALQLLVDVRPADMPDGTAGECLVASGFAEGMQWQVAGLRPVVAAVPA